MRHLRNTSPAWMRLPSGNRINLLDPDPSSWTDRDLAKRLARVARWAGESTWPRAYSVAQHSLLVLAIREARATAPLSEAEQLGELLHDGEEGLIGFDCISPLKKCLGEPFRSISAALTATINRRYEIPEWSEQAEAAYKAHKHADHLAAASEAVHVAGWSMEELRDLLGIHLEPLQDDPLARFTVGTSYQPWEPWDESFAAEVFEAQMAVIQEARQESRREQECELAAIGYERVT